MVDGVRDGRGRAGDSDFTNSFRPDWTYLLIVFIYPQNVDRTDARIGRDVILGKIIIHHPAEPFIVSILLVKREADTPDHAAHELAPRGLCVQNLSRAERANHAGNLDLTKV